MVSRMEPSNLFSVGPREPAADLDGAGGSTDANWRLAEALMAGWNAHDARAVAACYGPDFVGDDIALAEPQHGSEDIRRLTLYYFRAFPDLHVTIDGRAVDVQPLGLRSRKGVHGRSPLRNP